MTTIIVTQEDGETDELDFGAETRVIGIGRRSTNSVCIADRSVSALHARITLDEEGAWIEDLGSTNGTYVDGRAVSRQRLEEDEEIILGRVRVRFVRSVSPSATVERMATPETASGTPTLGEPAAQPRLHSVIPPRPVAEGAGENAPGGRSPDATPLPRPVAPLHAAPHPFDELDGELSKQPTHELEGGRPSSHGAVIEIKNGAKSGQILPIDKPVTTLGRPGIQIAAIMRKPDGYFLMHIESDDSIERPTLNRDSIGDEPVLLHSGDELNVAGIDVEFMLS